MNKIQQKYRFRISLIGSVVSNILYSIFDIIISDVNPMEYLGYNTILIPFQLVGNFLWFYVLITIYQYMCDKENSK